MGRILHMSHETGFSAQLMNMQAGNKCYSDDRHCCEADMAAKG